MKGYTALQRHLEPPAGTVFPPVFLDDADGEKLETFMNKDSTIAGYMISTLSSAQKQHVDDMDSATVIWHKLQAVHHRQGFNGYHSLARALEALKYVDGTSMQSHLHAHVELHKRITAAGMFLPEQHYVSIFLAGLPSSWDNIVPSLTSLRSNTQLPLLPAPHPSCDRCVETKQRRLPDNYGCLTGVDWATMSETVLDEELRRKNKDLATNADKGTALFVVGSAPKSHVAARSDRHSYTTGATCAYCGSRMRRCCDLIVLRCMLASALRRAFSTRSRFANARRSTLSVVCWMSASGVRIFRLVLVAVVVVDDVDVSVMTVVTMIVTISILCTVSVISHHSIQPDSDLRRSEAIGNDLRRSEPI